MAVNHGNQINDDDQKCYRGVLSPNGVGDRLDTEKSEVVFVLVSELTSAEHRKTSSMPKNDPFTSNRTCPSKYLKSSRLNPGNFTENFEQSRKLLKRPKPYS